MKDSIAFSIVWCLAMLALLGSRSPAQILTFVPPTDTITIESFGDILPSLSYSLGRSEGGVDSIRITAGASLYAGSPVPSDRIFSCCFLVRDSAGLNSYDLWFVHDSPFILRTLIKRDQHTTVWPGEGQLLLQVSVGGVPVDSMKVRAIVNVVDAVDEGPPELPRKARLSLPQNYPNPFNGQTTFRYTLPATGHAIMEIYDLVGRLVRTVFDETQSAGAHTIGLRVETLPSGVYFVVLRSASLRVTRAMSIVR